MEEASLSIRGEVEKATMAGSGIFSGDIMAIVHMSLNSLEVKIRDSMMMKTRK